ncbi:hypothetical protein JRV97_10430 [Marinitoga aeolica]|uniref:Uncharacterized protein n=2 Tax=Marinitoga aeolica TaxID=2809031 RepID=A0ABY8PQ39_9BACT|nr:hypothetical protein JRV97_10430 [Marinitoga aeolica]
MFIIREVSFFSIMKLDFEKSNIKEITCPWVGFKKRYIYKNLDTFKEFSYLNAFIIYGKLFDKLHDSHLENMKIFIKNLRKKIVDYYGESFITEYENILREQFELEKEKLELEDYFIPSIKIINMIVNRHRLNLPEEFSYYVGTLIYIFDALYDFEKDIKKNNFNPIHVIYNIDKLSKLSLREKEYIDFIIDYSIKNILDIFENAEINNKHFVKKLFTFSAIHHKSKIEELFHEFKNHKNIKLNDSLYLEIKK